MENDRHPFRCALIDLDAIESNTARLIAQAQAPHAMAVVKANGYGHGAVPVARAALAGGADWLGVADIDEALDLRASAITAPILCWLHDPDADFVPAIEADIDLGVSTLAQLDRILSAARASNTVANIHFKLDTGLSRNGLAEGDWLRAFSIAAVAEAENIVHVRGIFSHLANASGDDDDAQIARFRQGLDLAAQAGLAPSIRHMVSTAGALRCPDAIFDLVRLGIGVYGLSPFSNEPLDSPRLIPAMSLRSRVIAVRDVEAGTGVSYDFVWRANRATRLALVPLGYADGIPRQASGAAHVSIGGRVYPVVGRIAMDQFVVDVGTADVVEGDEVVVFGDTRSGVWGADDWARAADTINYDIVTGIGMRVPRIYTGGV